ncbi:MAG: hypothetical protein GQ574_18245 [Crocinitomix sp.]|nr:hypothetical protein [Crocinitomix sp.]
MGTLRVQVKPGNPGDVKIQISMTQFPPTKTPINETLIATTDNPVDQSWDLDSGSYIVTISWEDGFQNISSSGGGNNITVNGKGLSYQVLGKPADQETVLASFGFKV